MVEEIEAKGCNSQEAHWPRLPPPDLNPLSDPVVFQQFDIDSYTGEPLPG